MPNQTMAQGKRKALFPSDTKQASLQPRPYKTMSDRMKTRGIVKQALSVRKTIRRKRLLYHAFCIPLDKSEKKTQSRCWKYLTRTETQIAKT